MTDNYSDSGGNDSSMENKKGFDERERMGNEVGTGVFVPLSSNSDNDKDRKYGSYNEGSSFDRSCISSERKEISNDDKNIAVIVHLGSFLGFVMPFVHLLVPVVVYILYKDKSEFVRKHAISCLNFQISFLIYSVVTVILMFVIIGFLLVPILLLMDIICTIIAAMKASRGEYYKYPLTIPFFK